MIRLTKRLLYTIEAVLDVACHEEEGLVRMADMGERQNIPPRYLEPVLQQLVREGILEAKTGPQGGYRLRKSPDRISVGDIVRIVHNLETAEDPLASLTSQLGYLVVRPLWTEFEAEMMRQLDATKFSHLQERAERPRQKRSR